jgi:hypothetical protein
MTGTLGSRWDEKRGEVEDVARTPCVESQLSGNFEFSLDELFGRSCVQIPIGRCTFHSRRESPQKREYI